jgi:hypothetical protein
MSWILESINEFCQVRNTGRAHENGPEPTPRVVFITCLLEKIGIPYEIDEFECFDTKLYNVVMRGTSNRMVIAHHDVVNINSENANDNSASVINAIYLKSLVPELNVVITDGEEVGFKGAKHLGKRIMDGDFGEIEWVLNIELSGKGGKHFMIGSHEGGLTEHIKGLFNPPMVQTPGSDCYGLMQYGIDTNVINPLPLLTEGKTSEIEHENGYLDNSSWWLCHSDEDTLDKISMRDMEEFVTEVLVPIVTTKTKVDDRSSSN